MSPIRAAGFPLMKTLGDPWTMVSGGPTQVAMLVTVAAGKPPMRTVGAPGGRMGPPTWGTIPLTLRQVCRSVILAAGGIFPFNPFLHCFRWRKDVQGGNTLLSCAHI